MAPLEISSTKQLMAVRSVTFFVLGTVRGQQIAPTPVAANLDSIRQNSDIS
jgi:hypothetical protein